jgi:hypothetical protein
MSTRNIFWGKGGRCVGLTTLPHSCADCLKNLGASTSWNPQGLSRAVEGLIYLYLAFMSGERLRLWGVGGEHIGDGSSNMYVGIASPHLLRRNSKPQYWFPLAK